MFIPEIQSLEVGDGQAKVAELLRLCSFITKIDITAESQKDGVVRPTGNVVVVMDKEIDVDKAVAEALRSNPNCKAKKAVNDVCYLKCHAHKHVCIDLNFQPLNCKVPPSCLIGKIKHISRHASGNKRKKDASEEEVDWEEETNLKKIRSEQLLLKTQSSNALLGSIAAQMEHSSRVVAQQKSFENFSRISLSLSQGSVDLTRIMRIIELRKFSLTSPTAADKIFAILWDRCVGMMCQIVNSRDMSRLEDVSWLENITEVLLGTHKEALFYDLKAQEKTLDTLPAFFNQFGLINTSEEFHKWADGAMETLKNLSATMISIYDLVQKSQIYICESLANNEAQRMMMWQQPMINSHAPPLLFSNPLQQQTVFGSMSSMPSIPSFTLPNSSSSYNLNRMRGMMDIPNQRRSALNVLDYFTGDKGADLSTGGIPEVGEGPQNHLYGSSYQYLLGAHGAPRSEHNNSSYSLLDHKDNEDNATHEEVITSICWRAIHIYSS
jgi:hypothetical protein